MIDSFFKDKDLQNCIIESLQYYKTGDLFVIRDYKNRLVEFSGQRAFASAGAAKAQITKCLYRMFTYDGAYDFKDSAKILEEKGIITSSEFKELVSKNADAPKVDFSKLTKILLENELLKIEKL